MTQAIISRNQVAEHLGIPLGLLTRYEARGLVHTIRDGSAEGYAPAEVRRIWSIVSYQRDLGINLAGVEAILKLRDHLSAVHRRLDGLALEIQDLLEREVEHDG